MTHMMDEHMMEGFLYELRELSCWPCGQWVSETEAEVAVQEIGSPAELAWVSGLAPLPAVQEIGCPAELVSGLAPRHSAQESTS